MVKKVKDFLNYCNSIYSVKKMKNFLKRLLIFSRYVESELLVNFLGERVSDNYILFELSGV